MTQLTPIMSRFWDHPRSWTLATYEEYEGYQALRKALDTPADDLVQMAKDSRAARSRGRGLPDRHEVGLHPRRTASPVTSWSTRTSPSRAPARTSPLMMAAPHTLIEGMVITSYAIGANMRSSTCAVRWCTSTAGCCARSPRRMPPATSARTSWAPASTWTSPCTRRRRLHLRRGDGAAGLPGGSSRPAPSAPPFPAVAGLYAARPWSTTWSPSPRAVPSCCTARTGSPMGTEKSQGFGLFACPGTSPGPGQYEAPLGITLRELLEMAGGVREGHRAEVLDPGRLLHPDLHRRAPRRAAGLRGRWPRPAPCWAPGAADLRRDDLGRAPCCGGPSSTSTSPAASAPRAGRAPGGSSRSGRLEAGRGSQDDIDKLLDICDNILGGPSAPWATGPPARSPLPSSTSGRSSRPRTTPLPASCSRPSASTLFAKETLR
jgi:NADH-quinone oxidoreductase subunit F